MANTLRHAAKKLATTSLQVRLASTLPQQAQMGVRSLPLRMGTRNTPTTLLQRAQMSTKSAPKWSETQHIATMLPQTAQMDLGQLYTSTAELRRTVTKKASNFFRFGIQASGLFLGTALYLLVQPLLTDKGSAEIWELDEEENAVHKPLDGTVAKAIEKGPVYLIFGGINLGHETASVANMEFGGEDGGNARIDELEIFLQKRMVEHQKFLNKNIPQFIITLASTPAQMSRMLLRLRPKETQEICDQVLMTAICKRDASGEWQRHKTPEEAQELFKHLTIKGFSYGTRVADEVGQHFEESLLKAGYTSEESESILESILCLKVSPVDDGKAKFSCINVVNSNDPVIAGVRTYLTGTPPSDRRTTEIVFHGPDGHLYDTYLPVLENALKDIMGEVSTMKGHHAITMVEAHFQQAALEATQEAETPLALDEPSVTALAEKEKERT